MRELYCRGIKSTSRDKDDKTAQQQLGPEILRFFLLLFFFLFSFQKKKKIKIGIVQVDCCWCKHLKAQSSTCGQQPIDMVVLCFSCVKAPSHLRHVVNPNIHDDAKLFCQYFVLFFFQGKLTSACPWLVNTAGQQVLQRK